MVFSFLATWKHAISGFLAVAFAAAVVGGSIFVIMEEKESRQNASPQSDSPAPSEPIHGALEQSPSDTEQTPENPEQTPEILSRTPGRPEENPAEQDDPGAGLRAEPPERVDSGSVAPTAPVGLRIVRTLPRTHEELATAFQNAPHCAVVPAERPLELTSWAPEPCDDDAVQSSEASSQRCGLRRSALAIGLTLSAEEQERLPEDKRETILNNLHGHYISVQVKLQRDSENGTPYLHHLPLVTAASFDGPRVTGPGSAAVVASAGEFRTVGVWLADNHSPSRENLRTLVLIHRRLVAQPDPDDLPELRPDYELVFIHARPAEAEDTDPLDLHAFITSGGRARLHHLPPATPSHPAACGIRAFVNLEAFRRVKANPDRLIVRDVSITERVGYPLKDIERYGSTQGWSGDAWNHLPEILDAVIDAKVELVTAPPAIDDVAPVTLTNANTSEKR